MTSTTTAPPRRRRGWIVGVVVVLVVAALLVAGELVARAVVPGVVADKLRTALHLDADHPIDVDLTAPLLLPGLIGGSLGDVDAATNDVTVGALTADVTAHGVDVAVDGAMSSATARATLTDERLLALLPTDRFPVEKIDLADGAATASTSYEFFGQKVPFSLTLEPSIDGGDLLLTPKRASVGGADIDIEALAASLGGAAADAVKPIRVCLRSELPAGVTLTGVSVADDRLTADVDIRGDIAVNPEMQALGTCS